MGKAHSPRRGSMQYWPRKRSKRSLARVRFWPESSQAKPLAFIAYKAGMTHVIANDNRPKSMNKDQDISLASTIIDCPPMFVYGITFYKNSNKVSQTLSPKIDKILGKKIQLPKPQKSKSSQSKTTKEVTDFDDLKLLVHSQPKLTPNGAKKPKILEIALGGSKEDKLKYAQEKLGNEIKVEEVLELGELIDAHGITKGKGFQGTVKRFGVMIKSHKAEKTKRGVGNLGAWTPKRVDFRVPQPGKMGYHLRTEHNKQILRISNNPDEVNPKSGIKHYGLIKNSYLLLNGSVPGPSKRALVLVQAIRPVNKSAKDVPDVKSIIK